MRIIEAILSEPIAIHEPALRMIVSRWNAFDERLAVAGATESLRIGDFVNQRRAFGVTESGFAVIHVNDVLASGLTNYDRMLGATDYVDLIEEIGIAQESAEVRGILLEIHSPGGSVVGLAETKDAVLAARKEKPVVAFIPHLGASAGYKLAAASSAVVASQSAVVGSIGTVSTFTNISGMLADMGVKVEHMTGGDLKVAGTPFREMTAEEREFLQGRVDMFSREFRDFVRSQRPRVVDAAMRGQWFTGAEAVNLGLADQTGGRRDAFDVLEALARFDSRIHRK